MRKLFYLFFALTLTSGFIACSDDDTNGTENVNTSELKKEYQEIQTRIRNTENRIAEIKEQMKTTTGGRLIILQEEYAQKLSNLINYKSRLKEIEKALGL